MKRLLAAVLVWPLLALLAPVAYAVGVAFILRDLWRRDRQKHPTHPTRRKA